MWLLYNLLMLLLFDIMRSVSSAVILYNLTPHRNDVFEKVVTLLFQFPDTKIVDLFPFVKTNQSSCFIASLDTTLCCLWDITSNRKHHVTHVNKMGPEMRDALQIASFCLNCYKLPLKTLAERMGQPSGLCLEV